MNKVKRMAVMAGVVITFGWLGGVTIYYENRKAAAAENCDEYYQKAYMFVRNSLDAQGSIAYSLLYQNCLVRNKR